MSNVSEDQLCQQLAGLGYPGFSYLGGCRNVSPTEVVLEIFLRPGVDPRLLAGIPWVLSTQTLNWEHLVSTMRSENRQNSFGYFVSLGRQLAEVDNRPKDASRLLRWEVLLYNCRLPGEDDMHNPMMTDGLRDWLLRYRPKQAADWAVLYNTDFADIRKHSIE